MSEADYVFMPFGKHKGRLVADVPSPYLAWMLRECDNLKEYLRSTIESELDRRVHRDDDVPALEHPGVLAWRANWRKIIGLAHPDRGGDERLCQLLTYINDLMNEGRVSA